MTTLQRLERSIAREEAKRGSDSPFVKDLKEQLRAMKANSGKTSKEVYLMSAVDFSKPKSNLPDAPKREAFDSQEQFEEAMDY